MATPRIARLLATLVAASALVLTDPSGAHATAIGSTPVRTFEYTLAA